MKKIIFILFLSSFCSGDCDIPSALTTLAPGAQWALYGNQYAGLRWIDKVQIEPSAQAVSQAISNCLANQVQLSVYQVELSTTETSLIGKTTGYVSANAIGQVQINAKLARISELRALLGLQ